MDPSTTPDRDGSDEVYVLKRGQILGPFTHEDLLAGVQRGEFSSTDFVQQGGLAIWQPLDRFLDQRGPLLHGAVAPDWKSILVWARIRLQHDVSAGSFLIGLASVVVGTILLLLALWPMVFWLPWFLLPIVTALFAIKRGRPLVGFALLLVVAAVPVAFSFYSRETLSKDRAPIAVNPLPSAPAPASDPSLGVTAPPGAASLPAPPPPPIEPQRQDPLPAPLPAAAEAANTPTAPALEMPPLPAPRAVADSEAPEGDLVQRYSGALILVKGAEGSGSGFICKADGQPRMLTNIHVVAGMKQPEFTALNGTRFKIADSEAAIGRDIFRSTLAEKPEAALDVINNFESSVKIGDEVVVLGNSGGSGVVTKLDGKLVGIGPDRIEVSAEFIPGNSGSPIVHVPTGRVIGIATYLTRRYEAFSSSARGTAQTPTIRRFGYRIDKVSQWQTVNWTVFQAEAEQMQHIEQLTGDIFDFLDSLRKKTQADFATETLRRPATQWLATVNRPHLSPIDRNLATAGFLSALRAMARGDVSLAEGKFRYGYFRDGLAREREVRDRLYQGFDEDAKRMASTTGRAGY